ncbi:MAG: cation-translocating P-type ATPase [Verrucomicrobia bacterium]|nr:cation-translocating P-type ATPase [Verrucomicrobiota bacterium]
MRENRILSRSEARALREEAGGGVACSCCAVPGAGEGGHEHEHEHISVRLPQMFVGLIFVINSYVLHWVFPETGAAVASASAMIGALILGIPIVLNSIRDLQRNILSINELVTIAVLACFGSGNYQTAGVVAFFLLLGELIETRTAEGARASIESLIKLTPTRARRIRPDGSEEEIPAQELRVGDVIRVRPGDSVPADGVIVSGEASINEANITGESLPVDKGTGDQVFAGTQNLTGALEVRVTRAGEDTTLGRVRELILAAQKTKLPFLRIVDQYMVYYTPLVLLMGALVWAFTRSLDRTIAVLIVSCPCAFILASPTAMVAALSAAARLGVLIKNVADIELAARINAFVFDKTGTLTTGVLAVSRLAPAAGIKAAELLRLAASAEQYSNHPTAKALAELAGEAGVPLAEPREFSETAGRGVRAVVDGKKVVVGRAAWLKQNGVQEDLSKAIDLKETEGYSLIYVAVDGRYLGWIGLRDEVRKEAKEALAGLKEAGVRRVAMVTGDRKPVALRVAREMGCEEVLAECLPQDKVDFVASLRAKGYRVAFVGDGVNDAPALAAGDMGVAMGAAGSEVAIHSATIALMNNDLRRIPFLVRLSRSTRSVINQNFAFGVLFIISGLTFSAFGYINPILAAILHNVGSLIVVFNSARLVRQGEELEPFRPEADSGAAGGPAPGARIAPAAGAA